MRQVVRVLSFLLLVLVIAPEANAINWQADTNNNTSLSDVEKNPKELTLQNTDVYKFSISHGGCGGDGNWSDCSNDRQRVELKSGYHISLQSFGSRKDIRKVYKTKVYLPSSELLPNTYPMTQMIHQVKLREKNNPIWQVLLESGGLRIRSDSGGICKVDAKFLPREVWLDIEIRADYTVAEKRFSKRQNPKEPTFDYLINGKSVCAMYVPLVTKQALKDGGRKQLQLKFGIYNTYVSKWLLMQEENQAWIKQSGITLSRYQQDSKGQSNGAVTSHMASPFKLDWPVKLPDQTIYFADWTMNDF